MNTPLKQILQNIIATTGSLSIAEYMHLCHSHPEHGFYANNNPIGKEGDFITAPEISQIFGELLALWAMEAWQAIGSPAKFQLVELGPGRGTLMSDILRTAKTNAKFCNSLNVAMIESSPKLREFQQFTLKGADTSIAWYDSVEDLQHIPAIFIANEFLDAIPFRQYIKSEGKWHELFINIDENRDLTLVAGGTEVGNLPLPAGHNNEPDGAVFEVAPAREAIVETVANHINANDGAALFIDYGHTMSGFGNTFQAVHKHKIANPLTNPGNCDLTSHVDFASLMRIAQLSGLHAFPVMNQGSFLLELGLLERAGALGNNKTVEQQRQIQLDVERLAAEDQMGELFKVFCIAKPGTKIQPFRD